MLIEIVTVHVVDDGDQPERQHHIFMHNSYPEKIGRLIWPHSLQGLGRCGYSQCTPSRACAGPQS